MKRMYCVFVFIFLFHTLAVQAVPLDDSVMSEAYWELWNPEVQAQIDRDIDAYRKARAVLRIDGVPAGTELTVEQVSHEFIFGAHIFNFNQLGTTERNDRYKDMFGTLFNSATIAFYWKTLEMQPHLVRFQEEYWDTEEFWNQIEDPELQPHWRRPPTDPVVEFCEAKGIRLHGHPIVWGDRRYQHPEWIPELFTPEEKEVFMAIPRETLWSMSPREVEELVPVFTKRLNDLFYNHMVRLASRYQDRIHSWDIVNESVTDFLGIQVPSLSDYDWQSHTDFNGNSVTGNRLTLSRYGSIMPGDYTYNAFKLAEEVFPSNVLLNINEHSIRPLRGMNRAIPYRNQVKDLLDNGVRIDIVGDQMHLFSARLSERIAAGEELRSPQQVRSHFELLSEPGLPIHVSEVTITAPADDERGRHIQAIIARNLYRLWFSIEPIMGVTWWNTVDGGGVAGEPTRSGLFTREMEPKTSFHMLNNLINDEWKTRKSVTVNNNGYAEFRGFKGKYVVRWQDENGQSHKAEFHLLNDGDGI